MGGDPVKRKTSRKRTPKPTQPLHGFFPAAVPAYFEFTFSGHADLDLIPFLKFQGFDNRGGETNGETIAPF
jgi:hypothetical protein